MSDAASLGMIGRHGCTAPLPPALNWSGADDRAAWNVVWKLFEEDKLDAVREVLVRMGTGALGEKVHFLRLVEAEYDAFTRGAVQPVDELTDVQFIAEEVGNRIEGVKAAIVQTARAEAARFGWNRRERVLVTVLSEEMDNWWATSRFGYCEEKIPYYKICVPHRSTLDMLQFSRVFAHEFAHVMTLSASNGRIAKWLTEGVSVHACNDHSSQALQVFRTQPGHWLFARDLELRFGPGLALDSPEKWLAYQQAGFVVRFLAGLKGDKTLIELASQCADESFWRNLKIEALGEDRTEEAVNHVYGMSVETVFAKAAEQLLSC